MSDSHRLAVIDVETTGLSGRDRIVEFACITVADGEVVDEYETLIQPNRDPGPVHIHGITPDMLQTAPVFEDVAADIAGRLDGAVLVAHNISFDIRMLCQEAQRLDDGAELDPGNGICTYRLTGQKLALAAADAGLAAPNHTALGDARITALLVGRHAPRRGYRGLHPASWRCGAAVGGFTMRRPDAPPRRGSLHEIAARTRWPETDDEADALYLDALDRCLDDGILETHETVWLHTLAADLELSIPHRVGLHQRYLDLLIEQVLADGIVTETEKRLADQVAEALALDLDGLDVTEQPTAPVRLEAGTGVCFTGEAVIDGDLIPRSRLEELAAGAGMQPLRSVTRACGLVVAADPLAQSGKAHKARERGIPIIGVQDFLDATRA